MATISTTRAAYQHHTFSNKQQHPLTNEQRLMLKAVRDTIERIEGQTRNKQALLLRLRTFNEQVSTFRKSLNN